MPRRYPVEFRRKVLDLIEAGRPVAEIAVQLGITVSMAKLMSSLVAIACPRWWP